MNSLNHCKENCKEFIKCSLPIIRPATNDLTTLPLFRAEPSKKPRTYRFIEGKQPNWWQLSKDLKQTFQNSEVARELFTLLEKTLPFSQAIGKQIMLPELGQGRIFKSGADIGNEILVSYLFEAGERQWKPILFNRVWNDCLSYFNPEIASVEYCLYAPIWGFPSFSRRLDLGDGLAIRSLPAHEMARLASLDPNLSGVSVHHRITKWPGCFFEKRLNFEKSLLAKDAIDLNSEPAHLKWASLLNEETAILRCLLNDRPTITTFSFIRDRYPRDGSGGKWVDLPWQPKLTYFIAPPSKGKVQKYKHRRAKFLNLQTNPGWENVAASMRRYAIAWENRFRVDILADLVAALEHLVVRSNEEVSYKLRTRTSQFLAKSSSEKQTIVQNLNDAYSYRSKTFHGGFIFDNAREFLVAKRLKGTKGKQGNPFHDVNEVLRLIHAVSGYYRVILETMIDRGEFEINWKAKGL